MTVRIYPARCARGGWSFDIRVRWPEGGRHRERGKTPCTGKSAALRWAQAREAALLAAGKDGLVPVVEPPPPQATVTLADFWPRVVADHYKANRKKASTVDAAESIYRNHLVDLGPKPIDAITTADVAAIKGRLSERGAKTVNNVLSVLSRALRCAVEWDVIREVPCKFGLLKVPTAKRDWYEVHEYRRLVDAAGAIGPAWLVLVLLAGSAGLRRGEIRALRWTDVDLDRAVIRLERATWRAVEDTPKGGRGREIPMTPELVSALRKHRHIRELVLYGLNGNPLSNRSVRNWMMRVQRRANVEANGGIHLLRHTFCSHLAAAGVPAKAIQDLAGHADLKTTMRYMHLAPNDRSLAMGALAAYYGTPERGAMGAQALAPRRAS